MTALNHYSTLVLNADFRPLTTYPLSLWSWQDAVKAVFHDRVSLVETYEKEIHSPSFKMKIPSVIALREYLHLDKPPAFSRMNIFLRDGFKCQYCGEKFHTSELTFDHLKPKSKGGGLNWNNIVTACSCCNLKKGNKSLEASGLKLLNKPRTPSMAELNAMGMKYPPKKVHNTWAPYLNIEDGYDSHMESTGNVFPDGMSSREYWEVPLED